MDMGLLVLRLVLGGTFAAHGGQKLFGWFGGPGLTATGQALAALGFQPGRRHALMAGLVELAAGSLLVLGFLTPVATTMVIAVMLVAAVSVHVKQGFFITSGGYEYTLLLGAAALALAFSGPGALSLDAATGIAVNGTLWGAGALLAGLVGGAVPLAQRRTALTASRRAA